MRFLSGSVWRLAIVAVVLAVVGILAVSARGKLNRQRHMASGRVALALRQAIRDYYDVYRRFPSEPTAGAQEARGDLIDVLLGQDIRGLNAQQKVFLDELRATGRAPGLSESSGIRSVCDAWGYPYQVAMDFDRDSLVPDPQHPGSNLYQKVIVWSAGRDGDPATWKDNVMAGW